MLEFFQKFDRIYHHCSMTFSISGSPITMEICEGTNFNSTLVAGYLENGLQS